MVLPAFFFSYDSEIYDINSSDNGVHGIVTMKVVFGYLSVFQAYTTCHKVLYNQSCMKG